MKVRTDPDVIRKHSRTPRSYHEATGMRFYSQNKITWRGTVRRESRYEWLIWTALFSTIVAWLVVEGLK